MGARQRPVQVKEHRAHPLFAFVKRRQMRQQNAPQNQHDAHTAQRRHPLAEQYGSENGGKGRTQGAEKARSVGVDAALRHGLQGVAEPRAHHRQRRDVHKHPQNTGRHDGIGAVFPDAMARDLCVCEGHQRSEHKADSSGQQVHFHGQFAPLIRSASRHRQTQGAEHNITNLVYHKSMGFSI